MSKRNQDVSLDSALALGTYAPRIDIIRQTNLVSDQEVRKYLAAQQKQISGDWRRMWGSVAQLNYVGQNKPNPANWWVTLLDNSDVAGALGYHDRTDQGKPLGKAFLKTDMDDGLQWTVTTGHEVLEMLGDPGIMRCVERVKDDTHSWFYALEVGDPVESDEDGYRMEGIYSDILLSNFVTPMWFQDFWNANEIEFDARKLTKNPFELRVGGYLSYYVPGKGWQQQENFNKAASARRRMRAVPHVGSRRERRRRPRSQWLNSEAIKNMKK